MTSWVTENLRSQMVLSARCGPTSHDALWRGWYPGPVKANKPAETVQDLDNNAEIRSKLLTPGGAPIQLDGARGDKLP
jgi:hypothetical protein